MVEKISLLAPVSGPVRSIEQVPDEVFAGKMVGDGIAIDPLDNVLLAPCDGEVINIHPSRHALSIKTEQGVEILMHIGLETVALRGEGFSLKVEEGDMVKKGQELIEFDVDYIALNAKSLLTEVVISNMDVISDFSVLKNKNVKAGVDEIISFTIGKSKNDITNILDKSFEAISWDINVINKTGMHARPAAVLANSAKKYVSDIKIIKNNKEANAKSVVAIMGLDITKDDKISFKAIGEDSVDALSEIIPLAMNGFGEAGNIEKQPKKEVLKIKTSSNPNEIVGIAASSGIGIGKIYLIKEEIFNIIESASDKSKEKDKLSSAISGAKNAIEKLYNQFEKVDKAKAEIFKAHLEILEDPELFSVANDKIENGYSAEFSWNYSFNEQMKTLSNLQSELLAARANDVRDVGQRVLRILLNKPEANMEIPNGSIIIAEELSPSDLTQMKPEDVAGIATVKGSATSHFTIIAKTLGIPSIVGVEDRTLLLNDGQMAVLDGTKGTLEINISSKEIKDFEQKQKEHEKVHAENLKNSNNPAITSDGIKIEVVGNAGNVKDAQAIVKNGGEGIGLLRSEFLFLDKDKEPSEKEQEDTYIEIAKAMGKDRILIIRTLDVGGDKPLPYIDMPAEENPFLGVRGIRLCLQNEELFRTQLRAIFKAAEYTKLKIMFPMISELAEIIKAKEIIREEIKTVPVDVEIGIMIEVPSAAIMAQVLAEYVDFFSIGTNDLTQYTLAMDRGNSNLAKQADGLHPAVLRMIDLTVKGAKKHGKWVGVCGGMASEPIAIPVLIGLGVKELSASGPSIPAVKALIRKFSIKDCEKIANDVLAMKSAIEVRNYLNEIVK